MRRLVQLLGFFAISSFPAISLAQTASASQGEAIAEALFREGQNLMKSGDIHAACEKFAASQRIDPAIGTLLNLAVCFEKEGKTASAWVEYSEVIAKATQANQKARVDYARERIRVLEPKLLKTTITVQGADSIPGLQVWLDAKELPKAAWGSPIPIDPGEHRLEAKAPNRKTFSTTFSAPFKASQPPKIPLLESTGEPVLAKKTGDVPPSTSADLVSEPSKPGITRSTASYIFGGAGAGLMVGGGIFGLIALKSARDARNATTTSDYDSARSRGKTQALVADICFGVGAAALATGVYLKLTPSSQKEVSASFVPSAGGGAMMLTGRF